jgi:hypothetical protein
MNGMLAVLDKDVIPKRAWHADEITGKGVWHGKVRQTPDPIILQLYWAFNSKESEQYIGTFRLHLNELLVHRYIREDGPHHVRVNFININGTIVLATSRKGPKIVIGQQGII